MLLLLRTSQKQPTIYDLHIPHNITEQHSGSVWPGFRSEQPWLHRWCLIPRRKYSYPSSPHLGFIGVPLVFSTYLPLYGFIFISIFHVRNGPGLATVLPRILCILLAKCILWRSSMFSHLLLLYRTNWVFAIYITRDHRKFRPSVKLCKSLAGTSLLFSLDSHPTSFRRLCPCPTTLRARCTCSFIYSSGNGRPMIWVRTQAFEFDWNVRYWYEQCGCPIFNIKLQSLKAIEAFFTKAPFTLTILQIFGWHMDSERFSLFITSRSQYEYVK